MRGKQYRKKTGARSWAGAEEAKKVLEAQLTGGTFCPLPPRPMGRLLCETIETFKANKLAQKRMAATFSRYGFKILTPLPSIALFAVGSVMGSLKQQQLLVSSKLILG